MSSVRDFLPPDKWKRPVFILLGALLGLGLFLLKISNAPSYLSDSPETCVNCHIMGPQYATWNHSSHREWTTCNDCHVPQTNRIATYYFKAKDGLRHANMFTLRKEPQVIRIKEAGEAVVQENCKRCHFYLNQEVTSIKVNYRNRDHGKGKYCWECHREVPHGRVKGLSTTPFARVPRLGSPVPKWLQNYLKEK